MERRSTGALTSKAHARNVPRSRHQHWWETVFDEQYLKTYVDIVTPERTVQQVAFLMRHLRLKKSAHILDLACGYGRHAIALSEKGHAVTGLDFSKHFIALAKRHATERGVNTQFIHADMRNLAFVNRFDAVISIFTSFGYFEDDSDNVLVLKKISQALKPNGEFIIDLNNLTRIIAWLSREGVVDNTTHRLTATRTEKLSNGLVVTTKDEFHSLTMRASKTRIWKERSTQKRYTTDVRLFSLPEFSCLLEEQGLAVTAVWGDFDDSRFGSDSRRMIIRARKNP